MLLVETGEELLREVPSAPRIAQRRESLRSIWVRFCHFYNSNWNRTVQTTPQPCPGSRELRSLGEPGVSSAPARGRRAGPAALGRALKRGSCGLCPGALCPPPRTARRLRSADPAGSRTCRRAGSHRLHRGARGSEQPGSPAPWHVSGRKRPSGSAQCPPGPLVAASGCEVGLQPPGESHSSRHWTQRWSVLPSVVSPDGAAP